MSESSSETNGSESGKGITDDQLPDDLNPEKNPLAQDPEDTDETGDTRGTDPASEQGEPG